MKTLSIKSTARIQMIDITGSLQSLVREQGVRQGICTVFVPHTTAAVTINENADPDVVRDITSAMERIVPADGPYRHREGNSDAHIKVSFFGASETVIIEGGRLVLGTWQSVFFCEFDGPRTRNVLVKLVADS
ncbi:MAG TPA: secondary thiamine-phosphate synthase enzyme YjbQ [Syntrophales bacterium]|nr:secondary thiamine-phosphate synthase enzyme YjbQ [Syntrophales bacterium]